MFLSSVLIRINISECLWRIVLKKLQDKPELCREVRGHNESVKSAVREFKGHDSLKGARKQLSYSIIRPHSEMEGRGLRKTYVAIGREWMEEARIASWREGNKRVLKQEKSKKMMKAVTAACVFLFALFNTMALYHTVREDIVPAFGEHMVKLKEGGLPFEDLSHFANMVLLKLGKDTSFNTFLPKGMSLPPNIQMAWKKRLDRLRTATSPKVRTILLDPKRKGVYHVLCEAELPGSADVEFRLQCEKRGTQFAFLALE